ncbi:hypothetical protein JHK87_043547 [Glycine soja]|nr:hypothetical protein JHK87_043547 [Glycine soja]
MLFDFKELRVSWDSYLMTRTTLLFATVPTIQVLKNDSLISVAEPKYEDTLTLTLTLNLNPDPYANLPGGSAQTKEYYSYSSSCRRKSLDRSSSIRRIIGVVVEMDELKTPKEEVDVAKEEEEDILNAMKDHMDLDSQTKKPLGSRDLKGNF